MRFYHGTCQSNADQILSEGLQPGYLTLCLEQAEYYADCAAEEHDCMPMVLIVDAPESSLKADMRSLEEPLTFTLNRLDLSEDDFHEALGEDGWPEPDDWKHSLALSLCVTTGFVPAQNITVRSDECLEEPEWLTSPTELFD